MLRRALRHVFTILTVLSLLLCVALVLLTLVASRESKIWMWRGKRTHALSITEYSFSAIACEGWVGLRYARIRVAWNHAVYLERSPDGFSYSRGRTLAYFTDPDNYADWSWRGYGYQFGGTKSLDRVRRESSYWLIVPWWLGVAVTSIPLNVWMVTQIRRRRASHRLKIGLCPACGYDLRATPERCPECGTTNPRAV